MSTVGDIKQANSEFSVDIGVVTMAEGNCDDSLDMSYESAYDCDCLKLADWDSHPRCVSHTGESHARRLVKGVAHRSVISAMT